MTGVGWLDAAIVIAAVTLLAWLVLLAVLLVIRPDQGFLRGVLRFLPDVVRLLRRLAADPQMPRGIRVRLVLLLAYIALPFDLVPDVIPVLGTADDVIITAVVLRSVVRRAGIEAVRCHWPGTDGGFADLCRLARLGDGEPPPARRESAA